MRLTCNREKLQQAFQMAAGVAPARSPKTILRNVKFDVTEGQGVLTATDLEVGVRVNLPGLDVQTPGAVLLPVDSFGAILRENSDEQLRLESDGQSTLVRGERSEFRLSSENPVEFPSVVEFNESSYYVAQGRALKELVRRTVFATDNDNSRYALGGVLLELLGDKIVGVATDGRRLAKMEIPAKAVGGATAGDGMTIIPSKAMQFIERTLGDDEEEVRLAARGNDVLVSGARATIYSRLVEGRFPKWRDVFPSRSDLVRIELAVGPLFSAVRQAAIFTNNDSRGVDFTFESGTLTLKARGTEAGQSRIELPIPYDGAAMSVTLDPRYVGDYLRVLDLERTITLEMKDSESAAVMMTDDGYAYVIMPLARDPKP